MNRYAIVFIFAAITGSAIAAVSFPTSISGREGSSGANTAAGMMPSNSMARSKFALSANVVGTQSNGSFSGCPPSSIDGGSDFIDESAQTAAMVHWTGDTETEIVAETLFSPSIARGSVRQAGCATVNDFGSDVAGNAYRGAWSVGAVRRLGSAHAHAVKMQLNQDSIAPVLSSSNLLSLDTPQISLVPEPKTISMTFAGLCVIFVMFYGECLGQGLAIFQV